MRGAVLLSVMMMCSAPSRAELSDLPVTVFTFNGYTYRVVAMKYGSICFNQQSTTRVIVMTCIWSDEYLRVFDPPPPPESLWARLRLR